MKRIRIISLLFILAFVTVTAVLDTFGIMSYDKMMILLGLRDPAFTEAELSVHFIDVGQGDSTLIVSGDKTVLIDGGEKESGSTVVSYLKSHGIYDIDYVIATHPHSDHTGVLPEIFSSFEIGEVIVPEVPENIIDELSSDKFFISLVNRSDILISHGYSGRKIDLDISELEIIAPCGTYDDINNYSIVSVLKHNNNTFLFSGDAEEESEADMLKKGKLQNIDVLKAGHHGSSTSTGDEFLEVTEPEYTVISCGTGNSYNHPSEKTMRKLSERKNRIFRTDLQGSITAESDGNTLKFIVNGKD